MTDPEHPPGYGRKAAPDLADAEDDERPGGTNGNPPGKATSPTVQAPSHAQKMNQWQKSKGLWLLAGCIVAVIVLALIGYFHPRDNDSLNVAVEILKTVIAATLGFVFAHGSIGSSDAQK